MAEEIVAENVDIRDILPSSKDIEDIVKRDNDEFHRAVEKVVRTIARNLSKEMSYLFTAREILAGKGTVIVISENYFQESKSDVTPTDEIKERSIQVVVEILNDNGFDANYDIPESTDINNDGWKIKISRE